jgi:cysteine desulfurase
VPFDEAGYLDAAAGLPLHPVAARALQAAYEDGWADPGRLTGPGRRSALLLDAAREAAAAELDIRPDELSFLPSGAHALQSAVLGSLAGRTRVSNRLVHSAVEHSVVFKAADWHRSRGGEVHVVGVDGNARTDPDEFIEMAGENTATAVLQAANHEVGTRQPVAAVAQRLAATGVPLVVDASHELVYGQAPGDAPIFTADARLWGGPAGVGLLAIRRGTRWRPPFPTDESETGRGLGTPDVAAIVAAVASLRAVSAERAQQAARLAGLVGQLRHRVPELVPDSVVLGAEDDRLPHLLTFSCLYVEGEALLTELDRRGFAVSSGSSCTSDTLTPSHVLVAMGALSSGNVRLSLHPGINQAAVDRFLAVVPEVVASVRAGLSASATTTHHQTIDSRGRRCPLPIIDLAKALPQIPVNTELTVLADDPAAAGDIAAWCRMTGQELVEVTDQGDGANAYRVRRLR